jgi:hypothetical protein
MKWERLEQPRLTEFLEAVRTAGEAPLFNPATSEVKATTLPFYHNVLLYRLTNFASMPVFTLHFLSDGHRYFYLDGTEVPLLTVHHNGALNLTATNIIAYLNFYFFAVHQDDGDVFLVQDPATYPFQDNSTFEPNAAFQLNRDVAYEIRQESDDGFIVETPLFVDGTLVNAKIRVDPNGRVHMIDQRIHMRGISNGINSLVQRDE